MSRQLRATEHSPSKRLPPSHGLQGRAFRTPQIRPPLMTSTPIDGYLSTIQPDGSTLEPSTPLPHPPNPQLLDGQRALSVSEAQDYNAFLGYSYWDQAAKESTGLRSTLQRARRTGTSLLQSMKAAADVHQSADSSLQKTFVIDRANPETSVPRITIDTLEEDESPNGSARQQFLGATMGSLKQYGKSLLSNQMTNAADIDEFLSSTDRVVSQLRHETSEHSVLIRAEYTMATKTPPSRTLAHRTQPADDWEQGEDNKKSNASNSNITFYFSSPRCTCLSFGL